MNCKNCIYCEIVDCDGAHSGGYCHRFPKSESVTLGYWCGEHKPKPAQKYIVKGRKR
jgi:hypothetical protein